MNDFVPKPIELQFLTAKIKHWLPAEKIDRQHGMSASRNTTGTDNTVTATNAAADNTQALPAIEGLDTKAAIQLLGSPQLYMTVLKDYYRVIKQKAELIKKYEQQDDWPSYTIETLPDRLVRLTLPNPLPVWNLPVPDKMRHSFMNRLLPSFMIIYNTSLFCSHIFKRKKKSPHRKRLLHRFWRSFFMPCMMQLII